MPPWSPLQALLFLLVMSPLLYLVWHLQPWAR